MSETPPPPPISVVIPTIGRPELLRNCLGSLARCRPRPDEIIVVDQSSDGTTRAVTSEFSHLHVRLVRDQGRGDGRARNVGLRSAEHDVVLMTDDDCTVAPDWIGVATRLMDQNPRGIVTGQVLPAGDPRTVPSTKADPSPRDYTGTAERGVLYSGNMVCSRATMLELGGFDERIVPGASDNEFCHRWLRAGRSLRYEPELTVWHHDWRSPSELRRLYRAYAEGEGMYYAKCLRMGDRSVLPYLGDDVRDAMRAIVWGVIHRRFPSSDWRLEVLRGLPLGLWRGWRIFPRRARA